MPIKDNTSQLRGMLLEEAVLHFLRTSGYRTVTSSIGDDTLQDGAAGMEIHGRGCCHQIDAIADFLFCPPFSHPQRLLLEAKCYSSGRIGIGVIRNAVGVLKDVSEYWVTNGLAAIPARRHHYQYAFFSSVPYSIEAQRYAFAHDIYLIPLSASVFIQEVIRSIREFTYLDLLAYAPLPEPAPDPPAASIKPLREFVRSRLLNGVEPATDEFYSPALRRKLRDYFDQTERVNFGLLAILGRSFPVFLAPSENINIDEIGNDVTVRIFWNENQWFIRDLNNRNLFSFDLPKELFNLYAENGRLGQGEALDLKQQQLSDFTAYRSVENRLELIRFRLEEGWIDRVRERLNANPFIR